LFRCKSENGLIASKIENQITENINYLNNISDTFPRKNGQVISRQRIKKNKVFKHLFFRRYLKIIIGGVNVSILNKNEKW
jgi:hypothetical protein